MKDDKIKNKFYLPKIIPTTMYFNSTIKNNLFRVDSTKKLNSYQVNRKLKLEFDKNPSVCNNFHLRTYNTPLLDNAHDRCGNIIVLEKQPEELLSIKDTIRENKENKERNFHKLNYGPITKYINEGKPKSKFEKYQVHKRTNSYKDSEFCDCCEDKKVLSSTSLHKMKNKDENSYSLDKGYVSNLKFHLHLHKKNNTINFNDTYRDENTKFTFSLSQQRIKEEKVFNKMLSKYIK